MSIEQKIRMRPEPRINDVRSIGTIPFFAAYRVRNSRLLPGGGRDLEAFLDAKERAHVGCTARLLDDHSRGKPYAPGRSTAASNAWIGGRAAPIDRASSSPAGFGSLSRKLALVGIAVAMGLVGCRQCPKACDSSSCNSGYRCAPVWIENRCLRLCETADNCGKDELCVRFADDVLKAEPYRYCVNPKVTSCPDDGPMSIWDIWGWGCREGVAFRPIYEEAFVGQEFARCGDGGCADGGGCR